LELGRYRLEEQVGQGGMAVVWRGWDTQLRRTVAIKVLHAHLHAREDIRRRFDREAHAVARLHHPHIIDVYDFSADPSYLVTEFIRGMTLRQFADAHPFDPPELAAAALLPIAEALAHAHAAGVVHRDVKPENMMVRDDGIIKLTDFGIAAILEPDEKFTVTGSILGSPAHLAPETIEGKPADPRSDLFSFGTILYWLSCGKLPFQGTSPAQLLRNILEGKRVDPRLIRPSVSDEQARIIDRCLTTDPAKRYQSAIEVHHDLMVMLREAGIADPQHEVIAFVRDPEVHAARVRTLLVGRTLDAGEQQLALGKTSAALASFGRVLGLDPQNAVARGKVEGIRRRERVLRYSRRAALVLLLVGVVGAGGWEMKKAVASGQQPVASGQPPVASQEPPASHPERPPAGNERPATPVEPAVTAPPQKSQPAATTARKPPVVRKPQAEPPPKTPPQPEPAKPAEPEPPSKTVAQVAMLEVKLHVRFSAQVSVDGRDLGNDNMFSLKLAPGPHQVLVHHPCCTDASQEVVVTKGRPDQLYQLRYGAPLPAQFHVTNAPPDARVLVDGVLIGTASDPRPYSMTQPDQRTTVTIGDRTLSTTLKAGMYNTLDYAQATP
jgi:hypothetical protein